MPAKRFLIEHPDGSIQRVDTAKKEQMLLRGELRPIAPGRFAFIGERKTLVFTSFPDLERLATLLKIPLTVLKRFLAGQFIWEIDEQRLRELMETPEAMALGLKLGVAGPHCKWNPEYARLRQEAAA